MALKFNGEFDWSKERKKDERRKMKAVYDGSAFV